MPKEATMDTRKQNERVWLSDVHLLWREWVPQHPQHTRFAPLPARKTKPRR